MRFLKRLFGLSERTPTADPPDIAEAPPAYTSLRPAYVPPDGNYRFIALDVETANKWHGSICQIGLATVDAHGRMQTYSTFINPMDDFDEFNIQLHGIDAATVRNAPTFATAMRHLANVLRRQPIISHSSFDPKAMTAASDSALLDLPHFHWIDSVKLAQAAWPEFKGDGGGHGLANLKNKLNLVFNHHDAGEDARAAAQVTLLAEKVTGRTFDTPVPRPVGKTYPKAVAVAGDPNGRHAAHIVVFTGAMQMTREDAALLASGCGMTVKTTVTLKTTILVVGDQDLTVLAGHSKSSKHRKAETLITEGKAIQIIGETDFMQMVREV